jgi:uncharacterized protein YcbK (DUF882 family)
MGYIESSTHFTKAELACKCCGVAQMDEGFMRALEVLRMEYGNPLSIVSGYRCPKHNTAVSFTGENGPHTTGMAVDIGIQGSEAYELIAIAIRLGFRGFGLKQKGTGRFVHLDLCRGPEYPRPRFWTY